LRQAEALPNLARSRFTSKTDILHAIIRRNNADPRDIHLQFTLRVRGQQFVELK
jgi:hypothetical protein